MLRLRKEETWAIGSVNERQTSPQAGLQQPRRFATASTAGWSRGSPQAEGTGRALAHAGCPGSQAEAAGLAPRGPKARSLQLFHMRSDEVSLPTSPQEALFTPMSRRHFCTGCLTLLVAVPRGPSGPQRAQQPRQARPRRLPPRHWGGDGARAGTHLLPFDTSGVHASLPQNKPFIT